MLGVGTKAKPRSPSPLHIAHTPTDQLSVSLAIDLELASLAAVRKWLRRVVFSIYPSVYLSICLSIYLTIYLPASASASLQASGRRHVGIQLWHKRRAAGGSSLG